MTAIAQCGNDELFADWTLPAPSELVADGGTPVPPLVPLALLLLAAAADEADAADADADDMDAADAADAADADDADADDAAEDMEATTKSANVVSSRCHHQLWRWGWEGLDTHGRQ